MYKVLLGDERLKTEPSRPTDEINRYQTLSPTSSPTENTSIWICHEFPETPAATDTGHLEKRPNETAGSSLSTIAMTTFSLCSFTIRWSHPFDNFKDESDQSLLLPLFAVFTFVVSLVSTLVMMFVGVRFGRMQKVVLLMSVFTLFLVPQHSIILVFMYLAMILFLWVGWFWSVKIKPCSKCHPANCIDLVEGESRARAKESTV